jgi:hypothetical protein
VQDYNQMEELRLDSPRGPEGELQRSASGNGSGWLRRMFN